MAERFLPLVRSPVLIANFLYLKKNMLERHGLKWRRKSRPALGWRLIIFYLNKLDVICHIWRRENPFLISNICRGPWSKMAEEITTRTEL